MTSQEKFFAKWLTHEFSSGSYPGEDYLDFQREAQRELRKQVAAAGFSIRKFNPNHYEFSAVLQQKNAGKLIYVSISDVRGNTQWWSSVLIRTMKHEKDWTGGSNHHCMWEDIAATATRLCELKQV